MKTHILGMSIFAIGLALFLGWEFPKWREEILEALIISPIPPIP